MSDAISFGGHTARLTAHTARLSGTYRRNRRAALAECFTWNIGRAEIDIHSLDGPDYIVSHDRRLEDETTGGGPLGKATPDEVRACRFIDDPSDGPALLSEVVNMAAGSATGIQLDLKDWRPMSDERIRALLDVVEPIHDRVIISTGQDWNLRRVHRADPTLALGFDPGHYFDAHGGSERFLLPAALGAYGYRDNHPLALGRTESTVDYLDERMEMLALQCPAPREFFLNHEVILQMLDDGFDVVGWLHEREIDVTAWTPDYVDASSVGVAERLLTAGVDRITTNTIPTWVAAFATSAK